jgi:hypothetical protein
VNSSPSQPHPAPQVDVIDYQSTIANMTDHIILLEEKLNKLVSLRFQFQKNQKTEKLN